MLLRFAQVYRYASAYAGVPVSRQQARKTLAITHSLQSRSVKVPEQERRAKVRQQEGGTLMGWTGSRTQPLEGDPRGPKQEPGPEPLTPTMRPHTARFEDYCHWGAPCATSQGLKNQAGGGGPADTWLPCKGWPPLTTWSTTKRKRDNRRQSARDTTGTLLPYLSLITLLISLVLLDFVCIYPFFIIYLVNQCKFTFHCFEIILVYCCQLLSVFFSPTSFLT